MDNGLLILLTAMILLVVLLYWNSRNQTSETDHHSDAHSIAHLEKHPAAAAIETPEAIPDEEQRAEIPTPDLEELVPQAEPQKQDDLTKIEGIGPKIAGLLVEGDISSFGALAAAELGRLEEILEAAGSRYRLADPTSWPDRASLAAAREWVKLTELQDNLSGGRTEEN